MTAGLKLITVVICTRNRAKQLRDVLKSVQELEVPEDLNWEIIVVDNGSNDDTPDIVAQFENLLPIKYAFEQTPGLSNARNRGVAEATGEYICWTDDDVQLDSLWLKSYAEAFKANPDAAFFGGVIEPVLQGTPPLWFVENRASLSNLLAERNFGAVALELSAKEDRMPFGANFAVRREEQLGHLYNPELGVRPHHNRVGEETAVLNAISGSGARGVWVPMAKVFHIIPEARQTIAYVRQYQKAAGETWAFLREGGANKNERPDGLRISGVPTWALFAFVAQSVLFRLTRWSRPSHQWLKHLQHSSYLWGAIDFWHRESAAKLNQQHT